MIVETSTSELKEAIDHEETMMLLAYTSMCGTCESAKKMMDVVSEANSKISYRKINVNFNKTIIDAYNMTSIPCFLLFKNGKLIETFYAFHSVVYLLEKVKSLIA